MRYKFSVAIIGCGNRGADCYGKMISEDKDKFKIVSICDIDVVKLEKYAHVFGVSEENAFSDEYEFFACKRADVLIIATLDKDHFRHCMRALELGYNILLEKPITSDENECKALLNACNKYGGKVIVCHVLRYAPAFLKVKELIGNIGSLVAVQAIEQVAYWHQAHSYIRGNWRNTDETAPMILAKCCHDLDLLQYYAGSRCKSISSVGGLSFFKAENAPVNSAEFCLDCSLKKDCAYSAVRIYLDDWKNNGRPAFKWPQSVVTSAYPLTEEAIVGALRRGNYGKCVFACDNNAVDHQITEMTFENGVKASLIMTAFTANGGRIYKFFGTAGEVVLDEEKSVIEVKKFGEAKETIKFENLNEGGHAHGGGDYGLITNLYSALTGESINVTSLENSLESHLMGICAEKSRLSDGKIVFVHN